MDHEIMLKELLKKSDNKFLKSLVTQIPFLIPGKDYQCTETKKVSHPGAVETIFHLVCDAGVEVDFSCLAWEDSCTVEFSGKVRNTGTEVSSHLKGPFAAYLSFKDPENKLFEDLTKLRSRTIMGGGNVASNVPPVAYRISDVIGTVSMHGGKCYGHSTEQEIPCLMMTDAEQTCGFYLFLEWSGKWILEASRSRESVLGVWAHPAVTNFRLQPGEEIELPRAVLCFFDGNLDDGGNAMRRYFEKHVRRDHILPVFYNHYYAFAEKFDENDLKREADFYAELGCEYFVVDGGWYLKGFRAGIGNWDIPDPEIFPSGLEHFADYVRSRGMKFGLWFEPEFAMKDSSWVQKYPQYYMDAPGRVNQITCQPHQTKLYRFHDPAARKAWLDFMVKTVKQYGIEWIRWDCNEALSGFWESNETPEDVGKVHYLYICGLYAFLDEFRKACPQVHIETCAGGGNRMDPGLFRRADSAWMSDNVWIHTARSYQRNLNVFVPGYSNSLFRPWVPFETVPLDHLYSRFAGSLGFSERSRNFSESAKEEMKKLVRKYKEIRHLLLKDYHRLFVPATLSEPDGWQFHDPETDEGIFAVFRCDSPTDSIPVTLKFTDGGEYEAEDIATGKTFRFSGGKEIAVTLDQKSDAVLYHYHKIS
ncbi:MAG: alpha-galactosidase [Lentisphaerae bacterium]|nr:alpha-galactosidase [Lentisphaerota bacterium]